jgi:DNA-binding transcriptional LysR family regulator
MASELDDLSAFAAVVRAGGFREAARGSRSSASALSEAVRRLEERLGVRSSTERRAASPRPRPASVCSIAFPLPSANSTRRWMRSTPPATGQPERCV